MEENMILNIDHNPLMDDNNNDDNNDDNLLRDDKVNFTEKIQKISYDNYIY